MSEQDTERAGHGGHQHGHEAGHAHTHAHEDDCGCGHDHSHDHHHHHGLGLSRQPARSLKVGRNDPCPCGSGKKYKKCCLAA